MTAETEHEGPRPRAASVFDVAKVAGVSHQTVSRVLNDHPSLRAATRERVLQAMRELDYRPNAAARALSSSRSRMIGVLSTSSGEYGPASVVAAVEAAARSRGYSVTIANADGLDRHSVNEAVRHLADLSAEGLVVVAPQTRVLEALERLAITLPYVTLQTLGAGVIGAPSRPVGPARVAASTPAPPDPNAIAASAVLSDADGGAPASTADARDAALSDADGGAPASTADAGDAARWGAGASTPAPGAAGSGPSGAAAGAAAAAGGTGEGTLDQVVGARLATAHLADLGHERIGHIAGPADWLDAAQRLTGFCAELDDRGLDTALVETGDWSAASGHRAARALIGRGATAIFAGNDQMALGALSAAAAAGVSVPEELSVVGFDDVPEAAYYQPALTTVRQDLAEAGRRAVALLLGESDVQPSVHPQLVVRASTARVPYTRM